ncbi:MAG: hypothetical protein ACK5N8_01710 [Alphaproteobacteria bacterium]
MAKIDKIKDLKIVEKATKLLPSAITGAVTGAVVALIIVSSCCTTAPKSKIATANVQEIIAYSPKVQALQAEQKAKIQNLASFVKTANNEIAHEQDNKIKKELEKKYSEELSKQKIEFEKEYVKKLSEISDELSKKVQEESKKMGYDIVISKDVTIAGSEDITEKLKEVVK